MLAEDVVIGLAEAVELDSVAVELLEDSVVELTVDDVDDAMVFVPVEVDTGDVVDADEVVAVESDVNVEVGEEVEDDDLSELDVPVEVYDDVIVVVGVDDVTVDEAVVMEELEVLDANDEEEDTIEVLNDVLIEVEGAELAK